MADHHDSLSRLSFFIRSIYCRINTSSVTHMIAFHTIVLSINPQYQPAILKGHYSDVTKGLRLAGLTFKLRFMVRVNRG